MSKMGRKHGILGNTLCCNNHVGCSELELININRFFVIDFLLFPDLIISSLATVSAEVNFFNAVSQAAALISAWNTHSLFAFIASFGQISWHAKQKMQKSGKMIGLPSSF
jgi:hypothetical protein